MKLAYLAVPLLALSACATIHREAASDSEVLLEQAGFQTHAANATNLPARQIVERDENGVPAYVFADPDNCRCLYVGDEKEYATLQQLRQQRINDHTLLTQRSSFEGGVSDLWNAWEPEGLQLMPHGS